MTYKDLEQRRAYERARYHKRRKQMLQKATADLKANPSSCTGLIRKHPGKSQRRITNHDKYVEDILTWMEKKGVE